MSSFSARTEADSQRIPLLAPGTIAALSAGAVRERDRCTPYDSRHAPRPSPHEYTYHAIDLGVRLVSPGPALRPFAELLLGRHTVSYDSPTFDDSQSDLGYRVGGGFTAPLGDAALVGMLSYSAAEIEDIDVDAFEIELGGDWSF